MYIIFFFIESLKKISSLIRWYVGWVLFRKLRFCYSTKGITIKLRIMKILKVGYDFKNCIVYGWSFRIETVYETYTLVYSQRSVIHNMYSCQCRFVLDRFQGRYCSITNFFKSTWSLYLIMSPGLMTIFVFSISTFDINLHKMQAMLSRVSQVHNVLDAREWVVCVSFSRKLFSEELLKSDSFGL